MPITGNWKERTQVTAGALRQGTGWNPVHAVRDNDGRNIAPEALDSQKPEAWLADEDYGFMPEDSVSALWGYGTETGTSDRPRLDDLDDRSSSGGFPPHAPRHPSGIPSGSTIRTLDHGAEDTRTTKQTQPDARSGWLNKADYGIVEDAETSDPAQYEMQTSMTQRDKTRTGSQVSGPGRASEYSAPIGSRRPTWAQRKFTPSTGYRSEEMVPRGQDLHTRPFWYRNAGQGPVDYLHSNDMYASVPMQRESPDNPWQGDTTPTGVLPGFVDEGWSMQ